MTPFTDSSTLVETSTQPVISASVPDGVSHAEPEEFMLLRILFYPNGKKREFDYDDTGALRAIDHGDGTFWLRSDEDEHSLMTRSTRSRENVEHYSPIKSGWFVFSEAMSSPPIVCLYNVDLNQATGDLFYETETMRIIELPSGERVTERLQVQAA